MRAFYKIIDYCWDDSSFELKNVDGIESYWVNAYDITEHFLNQDYCQSLIGKTVATSLTPALYNAVNAMIID